jgi:hypothetical protein
LHFNPNKENHANHDCDKYHPFDVAKHDQSPLLRARPAVLAIVRAIALTASRA